MYGVVPDFTPKPLCVGTYESDPDTHFFLADFVDMVEDVVPPPDKYMAPVLALHSRTMGKSPTGKFGLHAGTAYGDILQNNTWEFSWESFWTRVMKEAFDTEERICGPHDERLRRLKTAWFDMVLPRYLRPLESDGRSVTPCLVHADLWPANCRYKSNTDTVCVYDANAFWGHNEGTQRPTPPEEKQTEFADVQLSVDLGLFRNPRYQLGEPYLTEYWKHIPISEPREDAEGRNNVYMVRIQVLLSALFPQDESLRYM